MASKLGISRALKPALLGSSIIDYLVVPLASVARLNGSIIVRCFTLVGAKLFMQVLLKSGTGLALNLMVDS